MSINNEETIGKLIDLLDAEKLSVVVGAGFSKNASPKFLTWKELLKDMVIEMYGSMARELVEYVKVRGSNKEQRFWKDFVDQFINEKGYLTIASEYVKRHGYREVIDEYIEARTPLVIEDRDRFYTKLNGTKHEVDLNTHDQLLAVKWNNVYTFNYDNLLDVVGGAERHKVLEEEIIELEKNVSDIDLRLVVIEEELGRIEKVEDAKSQLKDTFNNKESPISSGIRTNELRVIDKKSLIVEQSDLKGKKNINKLAIESKKSEQNNLYYLVQNSFDLSLRKKQNIIKLHGTVRKAKCEKYGFDNDPRCHYIITADDYENYQEKHEAFVNLMRIALLQDSFCLIGFSGDDPNFTSWLCWVRDILDRRSVENKEEKVFFIDVSGHPLSESKKLFFKNHYIKHVPLFSDPQEATPSKIKEALNQLFQKLNRKGKAVKEVQQYTDFWQEYNFNPPKNDDSYLYGLKRKMISEVWNNREFNRLPRLELDYIGIKQRVMSDLILRIKEGKVNEDIAKLFILAFKEFFIPLNTVIDNDMLAALPDLFKPYPDISEELELLYLRSLNLTGRNISELTRNRTSDAIVYESILNAAFHFDFTSMNQQLNRWNPGGLRWKSGKIALISYFNSKIDSSNSEYEKTSETNIQEYIYFLDTKLIATFGKEWTSKSDEFYIIHDKERNTIGQNLNRLDDNIKHLTKKLSEQKVDLSPRGNTSRTYYLGDNMSLKYSIQYLQVIIEVGLPLQEVGITHIKKEDWYRAFKNIYTRYPYPCLFYSLQYGGDENFLKRIAEDYVYSNELSAIHDEMLSYCLKAYQMPETPNNIKQGILSFTPLFFKKVSPSSWRKDFERIVNTFDLLNRNPNRNIGNPTYNFLYIGLQYTSSQIFKIKIANKILSLGNKIDHIDNHILIAARSNLNKKFKQRVKVTYIDQLIETLEQVSQYYVLFNLQDFLSPSQKEKLVAKLVQFNFKSCNEEGMLEASSRLSQLNLLLARKIERALIENSLLWHNGINYDHEKRYIGYGRDFIKVSKVQNHISFSRSTVLTIFSKLKESLNSIKSVLEDGRELFIFKSYWARLVLEMQLFLRVNLPILKFEKEFEKVSKLVEETYHQLSKSESIMSSLISNDDYKVREGIQKLVFEVDSFGVQKFISEYLVVVNRIASKANPGLNSCINNFASVMQYHFEDIDKELFKPFVINILVQYGEYFSNPEAMWDISAKKEDVEDAMLQLNNVACEWNVGNKYWSGHKRIFKVSE